jgi:Eco57I restriction-modification methylase
LGYIAPSLWTSNEYGEELRKIVAKDRNLDRWIDFKSYQVFDEATNYTALQFFTKAPNREIRVAEAPRVKFRTTFGAMPAAHSPTADKNSENVGCC